MPRRYAINNFAHYPVSTCLQIINYINRQSLGFSCGQNVFDIRAEKKVYLAVKCLQCLKMFSTALLLQYLTNTFLVITVNTAVLEDGSLLQKLIPFFFLHQ